MDFRDVYSVNVFGSDGLPVSANYIMDSTGTTIWSAQEDFTIGTKLIHMYSSHGSDWGWGTRSYTLKDDVTVVGRYGDPWWNGGGTIRINDENGKEILRHTDSIGNRKSLIYRCKKGMTLYGDGGGDDGGVACWNILGNYHVVVKNTKGEVVKEDDLDVETAKYDVYMSDGVKKIGSFYYSGYSWKIIK